MLHFLCGFFFSSFLQVPPFFFPFFPSSCVSGRGVLLVVISPCSLSGIDDDDDDDDDDDE